MKTFYHFANAETILAMVASLQTTGIAEITLAISKPMKDWPESGDRLVIQPIGEAPALYVHFRVLSPAGQDRITLLPLLRATIGKRLKPMPPIVAPPVFGRALPPPT